MSPIPWDFLTWMERAMMFRGDMYKNIVALEVSQDIAYGIAFCEAAKNGSVVGVYQSIQSAPEYVTAFTTWIDWCWTRYEKALSPYATDTNPTGENR